jgi:hypothetical protein
MSLKHMVVSAPAAALLRGASTADGSDPVGTRRKRFARTAAVAVVGTVIAAAAFTASPAAAKPMPTASAAGPKCGEVPYRDRTRAPRNSGGVIFVPLGDVFRTWDNRRDGLQVQVWFNYEGVKDKWKKVPPPSDGGQHDVVRNLKERYDYICFYIDTISGASETVRYKTAA